jgi:hypothetical protein
MAKLRNSVPLDKIAPKQVSGWRKQRRTGSRKVNCIALYTKEDMTAAGELSAGLRFRLQRSPRDGETLSGFSSKVVGYLYCSGSDQHDERMHLVGALKRLNARSCQLLSYQKMGKPAPSPIPWMLDLRVSPPLPLKQLVMRGGFTPS